MSNIDIKLSATEGAPLIRTEEDVKCFVCKKNKKQYLCPKCSMPYCSLACYKGHGDTCTEAFYQQNVFETLQGMKQTSDDDKNKMAEILKRVYENDVREEDERAFYEKMGQFDLDDPNLFEKLPKEDQETFLKLIQSGQAGTFLEVWVPWWTLPSKPEKTSLVEEVSKDGRTEEDGSDLDSDLETVACSKPPQVIEDIPALSSLMKKPPSLLLPYHIANVIYAYAYSLRYFNGDLLDSIEDSVNVLLDISAVLGGSSTPITNPLEAIGEALLAVQNSQFTKRNSKNFAISVAQDVAMILSERPFALAALSDLIRFFDFVSLELKKAKSKDSSKVAMQLSTLSKKMIFFIAYVNEMPDEALDSLANEIQVQHKLHFENASLSAKSELSPPTNAAIAKTGETKEETLSVKIEEVL